MACERRVQSSAPRLWGATVWIMLRASLALLTASVILAACSGAARQGERGPVEAGPPAATRSEPARGARGEIPRSINRVLVQSEDGHLFSVRPDGTGSIVLSEPPEFLLARQPTWSPDGERVAWVAIDGTTEVAASIVVTAAIDGSERTSAVTGAPAFFLNWDPTGSRVAYLGPGAAGVELGIIDRVIGGDVATPLAAGQPFYFSWGPDGERLFSRVGADLLTYVSVDGTSAPLAERGGEFRAPQWDRDRDRILYATRAPAGQRLVLAAQRGEGQRELLQFAGFIEFGLNATGDRIAYQVFPIDLRDEANDPQSPATRRGTQEGGPSGLAILDLTSGRSNQITNGPVIAFLWSPDGGSLLYLALDEQAGQVGLRWWVWDGNRSEGLAFFLPTADFVRNYLPFFDQYAQTLTPWSPDGTQIVFAARDTAGSSNIWIQRVDGSSPPSAISPGVFASWSPR